MQRDLAALTVILLLGAFSSIQAHGGGRHVMGTVSAVDASHVEVKTNEGKIVSARLDKETKYFRGNAPATLADVKIGMRIVLHLTVDEDKPTVREARLPAKK